MMVNELLEKYYMLALEEVEEEAEKTYTNIVKWKRVCDEYVGQMCVNL